MFSDVWTKNEIITVSADVHILMGSQEWHSDCKDLWHLSPKTFSTTSGGRKWSGKRITRFSRNMAVNIEVVMVVAAIHRMFLKGHSGRNFAMLITHFLQNIFQTDLCLTCSTPQLLQSREQGPIFYDDVGKFDRRCGRNLKLWSRAASLWITFFIHL